MSVIIATMNPIYFDYAATAPTDPAVIEVMQQHLSLEGVFANPASRSHFYGWQAEQAVEHARGEVADLLNVDTREIVWTSGATESNNLALKGYALRHQEKGRHLITSSIEHKAVLDTFAWLENQGFEVSYLPPNAAGQIDPQQFHDALRPDTILASFMHVNNELGTINDIAALGAIAQDAGVAMHCDAAQSVGKLPLDLATLPIDLLSVSAHKLYGPKGMGALFVRRSLAGGISAQIHGGGHERGMRSGTLATHQIAGFGKACELAKQHLVPEQQRLAALRTQLWSELSALPGVVLNGDAALSVPWILNFSVEGVEGETLLSALGELALSSGSACNSASVEPSYVVSGLGVSRARALSAVRLSMGRFTTDADVAKAIEILCKVIPSVKMG